MTELKPLSDARAEEDRRFALTAAAQAFCNRGITIACPWEGDLDDEERERFDALVAAVEGYSAVLATAASRDAPASPPVVHAAEPGLFTYTRTFNAIAAATEINAVGIGISVKKFIEAFGPIQPPQGDGHSVGVKGLPFEPISQAEQNERVLGQLRNEMWLIAKAVGIGENEVWNHETVIARLSALLPQGVPVVTEGAVERVARVLCAEMLHASWEGLGEGRITEKGYKPFVYSNFGGWRFQGGHEDIRDIARLLLTAALSEGKPGRMGE